MQPVPDWPKLLQPFAETLPGFGLRRGPSFTHRLLSKSDSLQNRQFAIQFIVGSNIDQIGCWVTMLVDQDGYSRSLKLRNDCGRTSLEGRNKFSLHECYLSITCLRVKNSQLRHGKWVCRCPARTERLRSYKRFEYNLEVLASEINGSIR